MSMVCVDVKNPNSGGREEFIYIDTDDLDQPEYYYYNKAKKLGFHGFARNILLGYITAYDIEHDEKYKKLAD